jgi:ATP-dependent RNA helicase DDX60
VLEERFGLETRESFPAALWNATRDGETELENKLRGQTSHVPLAPLHVTPPGLRELDLLLKEVLDYLVMHQIELPRLFWELTSLFFLHIIILPTLPVSERACPHENLDEDLVAMLVGTFLPKINPVMASFILKSNRFVDIDGRVFTRILHYTISLGYCQTNVLTELVGPEISSRLETVWRSVNAPPPDFMKLSTCFPNRGDPEPSSTASDGPKSFTLLPFHNRIFDEELADVHVKVSDEDQTSSSPCLEFCQGTPFTDTNHWHDNHRAILPKHLGGEGWKDADERSRQLRLRRGQRFMVHMQRLSASLTGASGRVLEQILIPSNGRKVSKIIDDSSICKPQRDEKVPINWQKKSKPVTPARERIRQENAQEKKAKEDSSSQKWWLEQLRQVEMIATYENKMSRFRSLLRNPRARSSWLSVEVRLYHLHLTIQQWIDEHDRGSTAIHDHYTVSIIHAVKELYTSDFLTETTLGILATIMISLGFGDYIPPLEDDASHRLQPDRVLAFGFIKLLTRKSNSHKPVYKFMAIREDPVVWQLRVFGEYMDRSMDSAPDRRVSFQPDAWQREVLDGLDEPKSSLLVVGECSQAQHHSRCSADM